MRTSETFKEINHDRRRFFGGVASTLDISASRRRAKGIPCAAEEVPPRTLELGLKEIGR